GRARQLERDRRREQARLRGERLRRDAELGERVLGETLPRGEALGQPGEARLQQLQQPLGGACQRGRERDAQEVERGRKREHVEVANRDDPPLLRDEERVLLGRVQLDGELALREAECVAGGAV